MKFVVKLLKINVAVPFDRLTAVPAPKLIFNPIISLQRFINWPLAMSMFCYIYSTYCFKRAFWCLQNTLKDIEITLGYNWAAFQNQLLTFSFLI